MNIKIIQFGFANKELTELAFEIRRQVFVVEQKVDPTLEYDQEENSTHYLAIYDGKAVATARWRKTDNGIKLERFATLKDFRKMGIGQKILEKILHDISKSEKLIYLHSQLTAVKFYERNGFVKKGKIFTEAGIRHYKMIYKA
jgi:predicted GNAT family N-acyltransferase